MPTWSLRSFMNGGTASRSRGPNRIKAAAESTDSCADKSAIDEGEKRLNGHGRLLVRSSGTEPVIRVMGEGDDRILVEEVVDHIVSALGHAAAA